MYKIISNATGTRHIDITDENLQTIQHYALFRNLVDSNGIIDESVLQKLRLNVRALVESTKATDKQLVDLCFNVIYHPNMKAIALHNLIMLYSEHIQPETADTAAQEGVEAE